MKILFNFLFLNNYPEKFNFRFTNPLSLFSNLAIYSALLFSSFTFLLLSLFLKNSFFLCWVTLALPTGLSPPRSTGDFDFPNLGFTMFGSGKTDSLPFLNIMGEGEEKLSLSLINPRGKPKRDGEGLLLSFGSLMVGESTSGDSPSSSSMNSAIVMSDLLASLLNPKIIEQKLFKVQFEWFQIVKRFQIQCKFLDSCIRKRMSMILFFFK